MMVETCLESSQDFSTTMSGSVPQWKRELLQRRASRPRPAPPAPPPPPPPPPAEEDEELRYGPGIVKRLQSRYLSLALRDCPRRRASLRRAASLEHLLQPPQPRARPTSMVAPPPAFSRRESVKRARSVDALSRLDQPQHPPPPPPPSSSSSRPPRRPRPLLRETERPPPDLVREALRKFEPGARRPAPAARVAAVLRGLEAQRNGERSAARAPSPAADAEEPEPTPLVPSKAVSRAALEGIARAGSTMRYSFAAPRAGSHLPPLCATNPVLVARRVGVIRPLPPAAPPPPPPVVLLEKPLPLSPPPTPEPSPVERKEPPLSVAVEPICRPAPEPVCRSPPVEAICRPVPVEPIHRPTPIEPVCRPAPVESNCRVSPVEPPRLSPAEPPRVSPVEPQRVSPMEPPMVSPVEPQRVSPTRPFASPSPPVNGHCEPVNGSAEKSKISSARIERAWSPLGARRPPPPPSSNSVVFNFSSRKEVPDYIENDGTILRSCRRDLKSEESSELDGLEDEERAPSPCAVRFVNDNVLANGRSSLLTPNRDRQNRLKLQFADSLTRTHEYPSETSLCDDEPPQLLANTHIVSAALSGYTPAKTRGAEFQLGVTRRCDPPPAADLAPGASCEEEARSWSEARAARTDLLF